MLQLINTSERTDKIKDADSPVVLESFSLPNTGTGTIHLEGALKFVPDHGVTQELSVKAKRHIESVSGRSIFFANVEDGLTKMDDVAVTTKKDEDTRAGCSLAIHHHD